MKHLLSSTAFIVLNKALAKQIGLKESVLLADLISKEEYFKLIYEMNYFERYKHWAREDTPYVIIYKISKEIFQSDLWNVDAYHSYIKGENINEDYLHYGYAKASCSLSIKSREGTISDELASQINWCFDSECLSDSWR